MGEPQGLWIQMAVLGDVIYYKRGGEKQIEATLKQPR